MHTQMFFKCEISKNNISITDCTGYPYVQLCVTMIEMKFEGDNNLFDLPWLPVNFDSRDNVIGAQYDPPKPMYETGALLDCIEKSMDIIASNHNDKNTDTQMC